MKNGRSIRSIDILNNMREVYREQVKYWGFANWPIDQEKSIDVQNLTGYHRLLAHAVYIISIYENFDREKGISNN